MATPTRPTLGGIVPPAPRPMDRYSPAESAAFADKETFEVHETVARAYLDLVRSSQEASDTGFRPPAHFRGFDQWLRVLPTGQIVVVEVDCDPKTGREL